MTELNGCEPRKVTVKGPYTFSIGDTSGLSDYKTGGIFTQVKMPKILDYVRSFMLLLNSSPESVLETLERFSPRSRISHYRLRQI